MNQTLALCQQCYILKGEYICQSPNECSLNSRGSRADPDQKTLVEYTTIRRGNEKNKIILGDFPLNSVPNSWIKKVTDNVMTQAQNNPNTKDIFEEDNMKTNMECYTSILDTLANLKDDDDNK